MTRGILDSATLGLAPKLGAAARAIGDNLGGDGHGLFADYAREHDISAGVREQDQAEHPWFKLSGELLGGLVLPAGLEGVGLQAGADVLRAGGSMADARAAAAVAVRNRTAAVGGAYGAAHGALSADSVPDAVTGGLTEGALGAATGFGLGALGQRFADRPTPSVTPQQSMLQAADRIGIGDAVLPADAGGPVTRTATAVAAQTPLGALPIVRAANNLNTRGARVLESNAAALGPAAQDVEGLGTAAIEGSQKYIASAKKVGGRMYDAAVQKAGNVMVDLKSARDTLDSQIARLKAVPGGGQGLDEAQALRAELDKPFTVQGIRDWRTENFIDPKFRNTPVEGRMKAVVGAASRDVESALRSSGNDQAADLYAAADQHWREMLVNIKRNVEPIVGKLDNLKSAEGVASALNSAAKNNGARLGSFVNALPQDERGVVTATFLAPLGQAKDGTFTISKFAQDWANLSPIAKRAAFPAETRAALDDLATVGNESKRAMAYGNHSNTGRAVISDRMIGSLATGATVAAGVKTLGTALAAQYGMGRLLASPRFARWLARYPRTALAPEAYLDRLSRIARAEPQIANEVLQLQQRLTDAFTSSPTRMAAQEPVNKVDDAHGNAGQQQPESQGFQP